MSQVARVFVVLNLLVAAGFLFTASTFLAVKQDYKTQLETEKAAHTKTKSEHATVKQQLETELAAAEAVRVAAREQKAAFEAENGRLTTQLKAQTGQISTKDTQISELNGNFSRLEETARRQGEFVTKLTADRDKAFGDAREARTAEKEARSALAAEQANSRDLDNKVKAKDRELVAANTKIKDQDMMIDFARTKGVSFGKLVLMKRLNGAVTVADNATRIAMINVGKAQGVERGYVFDVVRGSDYIGRIEVDEVYENTSACTIKLLADGAMVKAADIATTTLN